MVKRTPAGAPSNVVVRSIALTPATLESLESLAASIAKRTGRKASVSAIVRALLRHVQDAPDVIARLSALVEHERSNEVVWGKPRRPR